MKPGNQLPYKVLAFLEKAALLDMWLTLEEIKREMKLSHYQWEYVLTRFANKKMQVKLERRNCGKIGGKDWGIDARQYEYMLKESKCSASK